MKHYFLVPADRDHWLAPNEVAEQLGEAFELVSVNSEAAEKRGAEFLKQYRALLEAGQVGSEAMSLEEVEKRWEGALSVAVLVDQDAEEWFRTIACFEDPLQLEFGPTVSADRHPSLAQRAAAALGYTVKSIDGG